MRNSAGIQDHALREAAPEHDGFPAASPGGPHDELRAGRQASPLLGLGVFVGREGRLDLQDPFGVNSVVLRGVCGTADRVSSRTVFAVSIKERKDPRNIHKTDCLKIPKSSLIPEAYLGPGQDGAGDLQALEHHGVDELRDPEDLRLNVRVPGLPGQLGQKMPQHCKGPLEQATLPDRVRLVPRGPQDARRIKQRPLENGGVALRGSDCQLARRRRPLNSRPGLLGDPQRQQSCACNWAAQGSSDE